MDETKKKDYEIFFQNYKDSIIHLGGDWITEEITVEQLYQAFEARMLDNKKS